MRLRGPREAIAGDAGVNEVVESVFGELEESAGKGAAGGTLAELLAGIPPSAPKRGV